MSFFADFSNTKTLIAIIVATLALVLLFLSNKTAEAIMRKRFPELKQDDEKYKEKHLNITLTLKGIAAGITVIACVISLM